MTTTLDGKAFYIHASKNPLSARLLFEMGTPDAKLSAVEVSANYAWFLDLEETRAVSIEEITNSTPSERIETILAPFKRAPWAMFSEDESLYLATPKGTVSLLSEEDLFRDAPASPRWSSLINETVFSIEVDVLGRVWASSRSGLWMRHDDGVFRLEIETKAADAITADYGASHTDQSGVIYFGGTGGFIRISSPSAYPILKSGSLIVTRVSLNQSPILVPSELDQVTLSLRLNALPNKLNLEYGLQEILATHVLGLQHKLEGLDQDWQDSGSVNVVTYQNLPPGDYVFRARGADSTGVWSDNEISLPIKVLPPTWRTWWAIVSYLLLALIALRYFKIINDRNVARRERLKIAEEGSAAFARLEDDYQAQREANEALLLRRTPSANQLLDVVETTLSAQSNDTDSETTANLSSKISALRSLQTFTHRTTSLEQTNIHALTNEITARLAATSELASRAIITNDTCRDPVPLEHAMYLCLVIQEALEFAITGRSFDNSIDPLIYIALASPTLNETGELSYELRIEDSAQKHNHDDILARAMPLTFHLIETGGGEVNDDYDAGNTLVISLRFPANSFVL
ncbi:triple tyrosine motif-containing protein [Congregibacter brevis]|uniref:Triple tyrosine motif-containing protein n=1 Tax=Congregibacter brevis TaxID=3081201 RepID=A0ABZ0IB05_9GAMM|nr:triple tyrosine motif-containing protein [Congregibacter sp. IMCC45268]